ncbi:hypothetical protein K2173_021379 [Erythroxylum novogranatense]|uniref:BZIP domain-containing protein n=1 Tax=Erythroxylum novogranatense TaxID=1862640 RepID=A0AAV8TV27_9ROSI|nr:hypothetical protein K2173_021379 [Erythroxylum novogranatense]
MATSSGTSSGSSLLRNSSSSEDLDPKLDQRKRKRMISNRESARRSRMRKQKHLDELTAQLSQLRNENNEIMSKINVTTQLYNGVEAENSILRAQLSELSHRLDSLNEILSFVNQSNIDGFGAEDYQIGGEYDCFVNLRSCFNASNQPMMDMVMY